MDKKIKILTVVGTRPEAIKLAPLLSEFSCHDGLIESRVCATAQHRAQLDQVLGLFGIEPDWDLDTMRNQQDLLELMNRIVIGIRRVFREWGPDLVLAQGDTMTTFSVSLAAFHEKIEVGHVEAGLRSGKPDTPWPEEIYRKLATVLARRHFAPTQLAKSNLVSEGVSENSIWVTGNTAVDAVLGVTRKFECDPQMRREIDRRFSFLNPQKKLIVATAHRRESHGKDIDSICSAISQLARRNDVEIVFPVHLNPNVDRPVREQLKGHANVHLTGPLLYQEFIGLLCRSYFVITDSGGIQEEAPSLRKPVLVTRSITERPEAIATGMIRIVGADTNRVVVEAEQLLDDEIHYRSMRMGNNPYGDGRAASRIVAALTGSTFEPFVAL
ncbi:UDP-N-acetylglucosamine 2-epimerase (non-hydrolyzing) [Gammaproteobacteria bacterium]|nr:UDP-N-acetylglucosamine 2-epimerase (non-hydrolyzing) [Gammaproteobacteria bacterium]